jgi:tetratricopeptide (TPR) repeat protein
MSILDGAFSDTKNMQGSIEFAMRMTQEALPNLDEASRNLIELTSDGTSLGDALGITKAQKNALLELGSRLLQVGQTEKAIDVLMRLNQLDPLDERAIYALGVACQTRGELQKAAQMYLQFLALDATNPMGYLRIGECLLSAKEYAEAYAAFDSARQFAEDGKGQPGNLEEALRMLDVPEIVAAGKAIQQ